MVGTRCGLSGKMITLNSNYEFTLDPNNRFKNDTIDIGNDNKAFQYALPVAYNSMNLFFAYGTGKDINNSRSSIPSENGNVYYLYGKTGTSSEEESLRVSRNIVEVEHEFKRLAIIISNRKLHQDMNTYKNDNISNVIDNAKNAKFYVLYFTFDYVDYNVRHFKTIATAVIKEVVNSETFQNYMNTNNE